MVNGPISAISSSTAAKVNFNQNTFSDNNQIASTLTAGNVDPKFAKMLLQQMASNSVNTILFGNQDTTGASDSGDLDVFGTQSTGTQSNSDILGQTSAFSGVSPQFEMSVYSSLIGKTVTAKNPLSSEQITGKVLNVQLQNNKAVLNINGTLVPTENLLKVQ